MLHEPPSIVVSEKDEVFTQARRTSHSPRQVMRQGFLALVYSIHVGLVTSSSCNIAIGIDAGMEYYHRE
jgi:hypothetical protein